MTDRLRFPRAQGFISLSADASRRQTARHEEAANTVAQAVERATASGVQVIPIDKFRVGLLYAPAGNGDHRFHTPRHFFSKAA